jgi:hypothetical protein
MDDYIIEKWHVYQPFSWKDYKEPVVFTQEYRLRYTDPNLLIGIQSHLVNGCILVPMDWTDNDDIPVSDDNDELFPGIMSAVDGLHKYMKQNPSIIRKVCKGEILNNDPYRTIPYDGNIIDMQDKFDYDWLEIGDLVYEMIDNNIPLPFDIDGINTNCGLIMKHR